jgi:hypothetical protein
MKRYLYTVTLPEALSLAITSYKRSLFKTQMCVSALAVPPLIPVAWTADPYPIPGDIITPSKWIIDSGKPREYGGAWYIMCDSHGQFSEISTAFDRFNQVSGLFAPYCGIFAASASEAHELPVPEVPSRIEDFRLGLYEFTFNDPQSWYEDLLISLIDQRHLI